MPKIRLLPTLAVSTAALALSACQTISSGSENAVAAAPGTTLEQGKWANFRDAFLTGYFNQFPNVAVYQGKHQFDGLLPDWSPAGIAAPLECWAKPCLAQRFLQKLRSSPRKGRCCASLPASERIRESRRSVCHREKCCRPSSPTHRRAIGYQSCRACCSESFLGRRSEK